MKVLATMVNLTFESCPYVFLGWVRALQHDITTACSMIATIYDWDKPKSVPKFPEILANVLRCVHTKAALTLTLESPPPGWAPPKRSIIG